MDNDQPWKAPVRIVSLMDGEGEKFKVAPLGVVVYWTCPTLEPATISLLVQGFAQPY